MMRWLFVLLFILGCPAQAGETAWPAGKKEIRRFIIDTSAFDPATYDVVNPCRAATNAVDNGLDHARGCIVPRGMTEVIRKIQITPLVALTTNEEDCGIAIETADTTTDITGTTISTSTIYVGPSEAAGNDNCFGQAANHEVSADGDSCLRSIDISDAAATVAAGGWWRIRSVSPLSGTCAPAGDGLVVEAIVETSLQ